MLAIIVGYVMLGVGTARYVAGAARAHAMKRTGMSAHAWTFADPDVLLPTVFGGFLWPLAWVYLLIIRPVVKVVGPGIAAWFLKPYRAVENR